MKKQFVIYTLLIQSIICFSQERFISPNGKKIVVIITLKDGSYRAFVNSKGHKNYQQIIQKNIYFLGDSCEVAYIAKCDDGYCVVVDGIEQTHYKKIVYNKLILSKDNSHWAYMAVKKNEKYVYVIDGKEQPQYDGLMSNGITFSPDNEHWAYGVLNNNEWFYIIDGEEQPHYQNLVNTGIIYSYDSKKWAYGAFKNDEWICVSNEPKLCDSYILPVVAPSIDNSYFEFGVLKSKSVYEPRGGSGPPPSNFTGRWVSNTESNGGVIIPKLEDTYGFYFSIGKQYTYKKYYYSTDISYTYLSPPEASFDGEEIKIKYYYFIDFNIKLSYLPLKKLSLDLVPGLNLMSRMKIEEGSFTYVYGGISELEDVKLKGGIFKGFPFNVLCGFGISFKIAPKLIISANANIRSVSFKLAEGAMGKNKEFIGLRSDPDYRGSAAWVEDIRNTLQISTRLLLD